MRKRGGNKLKYQVEKAVKKITKIGTSKKELREKKVETGIHSTGQIQHTLSTAQNFAKWLKDKKKVKDLFQLKRSHYREYIDFMKSKGVTNGHLINTETNLKLLAKGMDAISKEKGLKPRDWCPKKRLIDVSEREKAVDRSISKKEYEGVRKKLSDNAKIGADLQAAFGLRLREVAYTRAAYISEKEGKLYWEATTEKTALNRAAGVTKSGRGRRVPCRPDMESRVREMIQNKSPDSFVVPIKYNSLKSAYTRANLNGSHAFRHTYAREMLSAEMKRFGIEKEGRDIVQRMVGNRQEGFRKDYGIEKHERDLYRQVNKIIDTVHGFLGHGVSRSDLMEIYMG